MPRSRNTSTVRWLVMCARGEVAVSAYLVTVIASTLCVASNAAAVSPAGPAPTTRTSVSTVRMTGSPFRCIDGARTIGAVRSMCGAGQLLAEWLPIIRSARSSG
jgi:hypothetical protein